MHFCATSGKQFEKKHCFLNSKFVILETMRLLYVWLMWNSRKQTYEPEIEL